MAKGFAMHLSLKSIVQLGILSVSLPMLAQSGYHVEMPDGPQLPTGTPKLVVLVNDSQKIIEAYHAKAVCKGNAGSRFAVEQQRVEQSGDTLWFPDSMGMMMAPGGKFTAQRPLIMPGDHFITGMHVERQPSGCTWEAEVDAVLYSDGTYGGSESGVRRLQAHRDGIVASVRFWEHIFRDMGTPDPLMAVDQSLAAIQAEAERRKNEDLTRIRFPGCASSPVACEYWRGRQEMDHNIASQAKPGTSSRPPNEAYRRTAQFIDRLSRKIDHGPRRSARPRRPV